MKNFIPISNLDLVYQGLMNELYPHEKVPIGFKVDFIKMVSYTVSNIHYKSLSVLFTANNKLGYILHKHCLN